MSVAKEPNKSTWYSKFRYKDWAGKVKQKKKVGFKTKREAQEWEKDFIDKVSNSPNITFSNLCDKYLEYIEGRLKPSTVFVQRHDIRNNITPHLGNIPISEITTLTIYEWQQKIQSKGFTNSYMRTLHARLTTIFSFAVKYYSLKINPAKIAGNFKLEHTKHVQFWTIDEFRKFAICLNQPHYIVFFYLLFYSGCRLGEAMALEWSDVNFKTKEISITKTYYAATNETHTPKTATSRRKIVLPQFLMGMLAEYKRMFYSKESKLFPMSTSATRVKFARAIKKSEVKKIRIHDLRHSHASLLLSLGIPMKVISERLGHSGISITMDLYSHLYEKDISAVADVLNRL